MSQSAIRRVLAASILAGFALPAIAACQSSSSAPGPAGTDAMPHKASITASGTRTSVVPVSGGTYVTGAKITDNACARVVSAIGYLEFLLVPRGQEVRQGYPDDVRGRFGYLHGTLDMYGDRLPTAVTGTATTVNRLARTLSAVDTKPAARPGLLRGYRENSDAIIATCERTPSS
ncbi:MAG TPA: hypothetical protein VIR33_00590 [Thermopolyspora sp.]|jgi:hypothetical protein